MVLNTDQQTYLRENFDRALENFNEAKKLTYKALLIITTGTFVLSISFVTAFGDAAFVAGWSLMLSWVCMALSIASYLASTVHDAEAHGSVMDEIATIQLAGQMPVVYRVGDTAKTKAFYAKANSYTRLTFQLAFLGITLLLFFGISNFASKQTPLAKMSSNLNVLSQTTGEN